jgi:gliding motility-associated lipoprotein GldD
MRTYLCAAILALVLLSCADEVLPKPKAYLRLDYPDPNYIKVASVCDYSFEINEMARIENARLQDSCWLNIAYPNMKGTIYLTYRRVNNDIDSLLKDTHIITQKHMIKANEIVEQPFANDSHKVYGMLYEVGGNAASQTQFYLTDSIRHFVTGSVYFYTKPNYDSIYPAAQYLNHDIRRLMESIRWE